MKEMNFPRMANQHVYEQLKEKGKDGLQFADVITLFYALMSGRPICDGCGDLVVGLYLTCSKCYKKPGETFNLCPDCYRNDMYSHPHKEFVDNFRMLQTKRIEFLNIQSLIEDASSINKQRTPR
ncbi:hypothetical protein FNV43_RR02473 [Rhamnella rubrinervis]|uniref:Uncharacterized protein n=1 Tax=Rhamnella rubrinervis TaxID=2594499 RepID=A0A8K0HTN6_9ROSA|nr:hypothetical protein FNV43_RR02473 [Rhamnella rubrinervis]